MEMEKMDPPPSYTSLLYPQAPPAMPQPMPQPMPSPSMPPPSHTIVVTSGASSLYPQALPAMPQPMPQSMPSPSMPPPSHKYTIVVASGPTFSNKNQHMICPRCRADITTIVKPEPNMKTHLIAALLCALGCCCCVPCPYCMDPCLVHKHYCPACRNYLGESEN